MREGGRRERIDREGREICETWEGEQIRERKRERRDGESQFHNARGWEWCRHACVCVCVCMVCVGAGVMCMSI